MNEFQIIGQRDFTDGTQRAVYADGDRQFVLDAGKRQTAAKLALAGLPAVFRGHEQKLLGEERLLAHLRAALEDTPFLMGEDAERAMSPKELEYRNAGVELRDDEMYLLQTTGQETVEMKTLKDMKFPDPRLIATVLDKDRDTLLS